MTIQSSTLRPGLLVSLKTTISGNVKYSTTILEEQHYTGDGKQKAKWETEREVTDPVEHEDAKRARNKARGEVSRLCAESAFGLLCPEAKTSELEKAVTDARAIADEFNRTAKFTRISVYVMTGRIAPDDVEAVRAINSEVRTLLERMERGVRNLDAEEIRKAANWARGLGSMLSPGAAARVQDAIELYRVAFGKIAEASEAMAAAREAGYPFGTKESLYVDSRVEEIAQFEKAVRLPDAEVFMHVAERLTDIRFWNWLVEKGDLQRLMDKDAKAQLRAQLAYKPMKSRGGRELIDEEEAGKSFPPVTVDNVVATVQAFMGDADMIFRRGVANAFSKLDRRFRSHDGFKIGSRVILDWLFSGSRGSYYCHGDKFDTLQDIERAFAVLDGKPGSSFTTAQWKIEQRTRSIRLNKPEQFMVETEYFRIRVFCNGNAHLWMLREDLVAKVNKLLAEYYGEVVADGKTKEDPLRKTSGPLAVRDFDLFPTPAEVADRVIESAGLWRDDEDPALRVLEPSAGLGNLAMRAIANKCRVDVCELHPDRADGLRRLDGIGAVYQCDFLKLSPATTGLYDRVIMNPPFTRERDIDHVNHALSFLKPGGILVAIMSAGTEFRETNKAIAFREKVAKMPVDRWDKRVFRDLPEGSFKETGTMINTVILTVYAPDLSKAKAAA